MVSARSGFSLSLAGESPILRPGTHKAKLLETRKEVERGWRVVSEILVAEGQPELAARVRAFAARMPPHPGRTARRSRSSCLSVFTTHDFEKGLAGDSAQRRSAQSVFVTWRHSGIFGWKTVKAPRDSCGTLWCSLMLFCARRSQRPSSTQFSINSSLTDSGS